MDHSYATSHFEPIELTHVCSRADSDATADDLPGPGRTLDNVYIAAGHHIESIYGKAAKLFGRGSRVTVERICRTQRQLDDAFQDRMDVQSGDLTRYSDGDGLKIVCSRTDTDATADDLPGPGRTLGKLYDKLGHRIESALNTAAKKTGKGPRLTAQRIQRRRAKVISATLRHRERCSCCECRLRCQFRPNDVRVAIRSPFQTRKLTKRINSDCKQLLKYVKSDVWSTQRQAIDCILDLAICDGDVRDRLKAQGAIKIISNLAQVYSNFRFGAGDDILLARSRKALITFGDAEINTLLTEWVSSKDRSRMRDFENTPDPAIEHRLWTKISRYLHDTDFAFLVMRMLRTMDLSSFEFYSLMDSVLESVQDSPNYFEWEVCDEIFLRSFNGYSMMNGLSRISDWLLRNVDKLPRFIEATILSPLTKLYELEPYDFVYVHNIRSVMLQGLVSTRWGLDQVPSLELLQNIYVQPHLQPLLNSLVCPVEHIVGDFIIGHYFFYKHTPGAAESRLYDGIVQYIHSSDSSSQARAWMYVNYFLALDVYRCNMMLDALSRTQCGAIDDVSAFMELKRKQCCPKFDESDAQECFLRHFDLNYNAHYHGYLIGSGCTCEIENVEMLHYFSKWILRAVVERGSHFSVQDYYPLHSGCDADGDITFLAEILFPEQYFKCSKCGITIRSTYTDVKSGTKPENVRVMLRCPHQETMVVPEKFHVPVLRYAPLGYAEVLGSDVDSLYTTGPFSWRPAQPFSCRPTLRSAHVEYAKVFGSDAERTYTAAPFSSWKPAQTFPYYVITFRKKYWVRVITAEEAME